VDCRRRAGRCLAVSGSDLVGVQTTDDALSGPERVWTGVASARSCLKGSACVLTQEVDLDTGNLPRGLLRVRVIASDDHASREVRFSVRSTSVSPACPHQSYRVFFLGQRFVLARWSVGCHGGTAA
jgi:hypothetical protein